MANYYEVERKIKRAGEIIEMIEYFGKAKAFLSARSNAVESFKFITPEGMVFPFSTEQLSPSVFARYKEVIVSEIDVHIDELKGELSELFPEQFKEEEGDDPFGAAHLV